MGEINYREGSGPFQLAVDVDGLEAVPRRESRDSLAVRNPLRELVRRSRRRRRSAPSRRGPVVRNLHIRGRPGRWVHPGAEEPQVGAITGCASDGSRPRGHPHWVPRVAVRPAVPQNRENISHIGVSVQIFFFQHPDSTPNHLQEFVQSLAVALTQ